MRHQISVSVGVILIKDNKTLMLKRSGTGWMDGCWSMPAGKVDEGESLKTAALREAKEELKIEIAEEYLSLRHLVHVFDKETNWLVGYFMTTNWTGEAVINEPNKHADLQWVEIENLPENSVPFLKHVFEELKKGCFYSEYRMTV